MRLPNYVQFVILWQPHCALRVAMTTAYLKAIMEAYGKTFTGLGPSGHRPVIVKWAVFGSKAQLNAQFFSRKVFHDWSIKLRKYIVFIRRVNLPWGGGRGGGWGYSEFFIHT